MKNIITLGFILLLTLKSFAQTDGISYQAVIIGPDVLELPGKDSEGNYLPNADVLIKFTIFDSGNEVEFEEIQTASTDEFGRINLVIGAIEHDDFETIEWDGTGKQLKVEIDFKNGDGYADMSREDLTFVPYAYHRNITATGTLIVDDNTTLKRELIVDGPTSLNSTLDVTGGNAAYLTGDLTVDGATNLNSSLDVNNKSVSNLTGALNVGETTGLEDTDAPTVLNGTLNVVGLTTVDDFVSTGEAAFNDLIATTLLVNSSTVLDSTVTIGNSNDDVVNITGGVSVSSDKQVVINSSNSGSDNDINSYPVLIEGSNQGLAIVVNGSRTNSNNFVSFWDTTTAPNPTLSGFSLEADSPNMWGRIEGETPDEYENDADYLFDQRSLNYDIADGVLDLVFATTDLIFTSTNTVAAATSATACLGLGACVTSPIPSLIASSTAQVVVAVAQELAAIAAAAVSVVNKVDYDNNKDKYQGVTYASGAGDYAEYLQRENLNESMTYGDIVGVKGGAISKNTAGAERVLVVSFKPIVLGNMPQPNRENDFEKVAFMGQVPVKVFGKVNIGDYIVPSGKNDGIGVAIQPSTITSKNIKDIVGVAWTSSDNTFGFNMVNTAVGLNKNDNNPIVEKLESQVLEQTVQINELKNQIVEILDRLSKIENGNALSSKIASTKGPYADNQYHEDHEERRYQVLDIKEGEIIYFEFEKEDFEKGLEIAEEQMRNQGVDIDNHVFWQKIKKDPNYKNVLLNKLKVKFDKQVHFHKEFDKKSKH